MICTKIGYHQWITKILPAPTKCKLGAIIWTCALHTTSIACERSNACRIKANSGSYTTNNLIHLIHQMNLTQRHRLLPKWAKPDLMSQDPTNNAPVLEVIWHSTLAITRLATSLEGSRCLLVEQLSLTTSSQFHLSIRGTSIQAIDRVTEFQDSLGEAQLLKSSNHQATIWILNSWCKHTSTARGKPYALLSMNIGKMALESHLQLAKGKKSLWDQQPVQNSMVKCRHNIRWSDHLRAKTRRFIILVTKTMNLSKCQICTNLKLHKGQGWCHQHLMRSIKRWSFQKTSATKSSLKIHWKEECVSIWATLPPRSVQSSVTLKWSHRNFRTTKYLATLITTDSPGKTTNI